MLKGIVADCKFVWDVWVLDPSAAVLSLKGVPLDPLWINAPSLHAFCLLHVLLLQNVISGFVLWGWGPQIFGLLFFFPGIGQAGEPLKASELWDSRKWWVNEGVVVALLRAKRR